MPRKEKRFHFIYKTTNILTGRYYYGMHSTDDLDDGYLGSGKQLRYSMRKYGEKNHRRDILEFCKDRKELIQKERKIVDLSEIAKKDCMNLVIGGEGGNGWNLSIEQRRLAAAQCHKRIKILEKTNSDWVKKRNKNIGDAKRREYESGKRKRIFPYDWNGKHHKEETKKLIGLKNSINHTGEKNSQYGTCWIHNENKNMKIKKEQINDYINLGWIKGRKMRE